MHFIDSHCHLDFSAFDSDRDVIMDQCQKMGVRQLIIPGVSPENWTRLDALSEHYSGVFYGVGLHPWWISVYTNSHPNLDESIDHLQHILRAAAHAKKCVALGECGLDALIDVPLDVQEKILDAQLDLAASLDLPVILHCRQLHNELIRTLKKHALTRGGVIHGFSGSLELAMSYWRMGFCLGIGGTITYERAKKTREMVRQMPIESLLLETDSPDMPLQGKQGERNCPTSIPLVAAALAELREESIEYIAEKTSANSRRLFRLDN